MASSFEILSRFVRQKSVGDVLHLGGSTAIAHSLLLICLPVLARFYSPEDFGRLALFAASAAFVATFASGRLELSLVLPREDKDAIELLALGVGVVSVITCILEMLIIFLPLDGNWFGVGGGGEGMRFLWPVGIWLMGVGPIFRGWLVRRGKFILIGRATIARALVTQLVAIVAAFASKKTALGEGLIASHIAGEAAFASIVGYRAVLDQATIKWTATGQGLAATALKYYKVSGTLLASQGLAAVYTRIVPVFVGNYFGTASLGYMNMAERVTYAPVQIIGNAIGDIYRKRASEQFNNTGEFRALAWKTLRFTAAVAVVGLVVALSSVHYFVPMFFGPEWKDAVPVFALYSLASCFCLACSPIDKGALIVGAYKYIVGWHLVRLLGVASLIVMTSVVELSFMSFTAWLIAIAATLYTVDVICELCFSRGRPAQN